MTANALNKYVGRKATKWVGTMQVELVIVDVKLSYGCMRFQVQPVAGSGATWVDEGSVTLSEPTALAY